MKEIKNADLTDDVAVDDTTFIDCRFSQARLVFSGGVAPMLVNCAFQDAQFAFEGPAHNTVLFLRAMSPTTSGLRPVVENLLPELAAATGSVSFRSAND